MKYPYVSYAVRVESRTGDEYLLYNYLTDRHVTLRKEEYDFLMSLDGHTDPYSLSSDSEYVDDYMTYLKNERLIRKNRIERDSLDFFFTLWTPKNDGRTKKLATILNALIIFLMPISLFFGLRFVNMDGVVFNCMTTVGLFFGIFSGIFPHEIGHALAALAYGGIVYECGIGFKSMFLMGYTLMDIKSISSPLKRVQIMLAGLEVNAILIGLFLLLTNIPILAGFFLGAGVSNIFIVAINLAGNIMVDGFEVLKDLLGVKVTENCLLELLDLYRKYG